MSFTTSAMRYLCSGESIDQNSQQQQTIHQNEFTAKP